MTGNSSTGHVSTFSPKMASRGTIKTGHAGNKKNETLSHILNSCKPNLIQDTRRHNAIVAEIERALAAAQLRLNKQVPGSRFNLRPDIVLLDETNKKACIIDVQCPFDHDADALFIARKAKIDKYQCVADELRSRVFRAYVGAVKIGSLGCFDDDNLRSFAELGIQRKQGIALGKKLVSQTISHSRVIYNDHIHYKSSHPPPNTSISPNLRSLDTPATEPPHHPQQE